MKEVDLKVQLIEWLLSEQSPSTLSAEVPFLFNTRRADVVSLSEEDIQAEGFEIKSANDKISQLNSQLDDYKGYFDKVSVVCEPSNLGQIRSLIPSWVGIVVVTFDKTIRLRKARTNLRLDKVSLCSTMTSYDLHQKFALEKDLNHHESCIRAASIHNLKKIRKNSRLALQKKLLPAYILFSQDILKKINSDDLLTLSRSSPSKISFMRET